MNDIMKNIKRLRQERGLTQEELAEKLHVTRQAVSNWETGKNQPDIELLKTLAETFEVDAAELLYAPKEDVDKRKRMTVAAVFCVLTVMTWAGYVPLEKWAMAWKNNRYDLIPALLCAWGLKPLAYLLTGAAAAALLHVWVNIRPKISVRRGMLAVGAAICLLYIALFLWYWFGGRIGFIMPTRLQVSFSNSLRFYGSSFFFLPGVLFFFAWPRKAG